MNDRQLTKRRAETLAAWLHELRDDWDTPGILTALGNAKNRPDRPDAYQIHTAAGRCAADPSNRTPAVIALDGRHWRPWQTDDPAEPKGTPTPPRVEHMRCTRCGFTVTEPDHHCAPRGDHTAGAARARAELAAAKTAQTSSEPPPT